MDESQWTLFLSRVWGCGSEQPMVPVWVIYCPEIHSCFWGMSYLLAGAAPFQWDKVEQMRFHQPTYLSNMQNKEGWVSPRETLQNGGLLYLIFILGLKWKCYTKIQWLLVSFGAKINPLVVPTLYCQIAFSMFSGSITWLVKALLHWQFWLSDWKVIICCQMEDTCYILQVQWLKIWSYSALEQPKTLQTGL